MNETYICYAMQNDVNKKIYVGITKDLEQRIKSHIYDLRAGTHANKKMQQDFKDLKMSEKNLKFYILEQGILKENRLETESRFINLYRTSDERYGYNQKEGSRILKKELKEYIADGLPETIFKGRNE